ncbi:hypothetical protein [Streptomyces sp. Rer75]|uniref:hypothetical protein n=1 Tax=Streptomyces sp. Rer75 TaxID=2750011 RepID=UPI0015D02834|nr:hypothetical protein [Streptomyces sp. Rer75]QLH19296.1 hypothetical protein HYQ63_00115 [Streptomyces sp. Rer75]
MNNRIRTAAVLVGVLLPLTAACSNHEQGTVQRAEGSRPEGTTKGSEDKDVSYADCGPDSGLSQAEWMENCADDAGDDRAPNTELKIGDTFRYNDGLKVTVTRIDKVTTFAGYDSRPGGDQTAFRVNIKFDNQSEKPIDLDDFSVNVQGATKGGDAELTVWEIGSKEIAGRLAPDVSDTKNSDGVLDKQYGMQVLVTVTRMNEDTDLLAEDPHWTGPIQ